MAKKFSDNQVERLLDLVPYLTANPGVSLERIAEDFKSTKTMILEDLNTLWMCGLPGYTPLELIDLSFDTGYVTIRNADVLSKPRKLTTVEIATVIVGLSIIRETITPTNENYLAVSDLIGRLSSSFHVPEPDIVQDPKLVPVKKILHQALESRLNLEIVYFSFAKDEKSSRLVTPLRLRVLENHEYLDAYCHVSQNFRLFRLDRIEECKFGGNVGFIDTTIENYPERELTLQIQINSQARKVTELFNVDLADRLPENNKFTYEAFNMDWIVRTISSLQGSATLIQPAIIANEIATRARRALNLYR